MQGSDKSTDVNIFCLDGFVSTHRLLLASMNDMLSSIFKHDTWDEPITIILPDFKTKEVSSCLKEVCQYGSFAGKLTSIAEVLILKRTKHDMTLKNESHLENNEIEIKVEEIYDNLSQDVNVDEEDINGGCSGVELSKTGENKSGELFFTSFHNDSNKNNLELFDEDFESLIDIVDPLPINENERKIETKKNCADPDFTSPNPVETIKRKKTSESRQFFDIDEQNRAHCKLCGITIAVDCSTYLRHLKKKHLDVYKTINIRKKIGRFSQGDKVEVHESNELSISIQNRGWPKGKTKKKTSETRKHFDIDDGGKANCKYCLKKFSDRISCMDDHLRNLHPDIFLTVKKGKSGRGQTKLYAKYYAEIPDNPSKVVCLLCNKLYSFGNFAKHAKNAHDIYEGGRTRREYMCTFCGKTFNDNWYRKQHENAVHLKIKNNNEKDLKLFQCCDCGKQFKSSQYLDLHDKTGVCKSDVETLKCTTCNKQFTKRGQYILHIKMSPFCTHENIKKDFSCDHCNAKFVTLKRLEIHLRIHTGLKPFQCEFCSKRFKFLFRLNFHKTNCESRPLS